MGKRVLQVSLDILIDESIDGEDLAQAIRTELEGYGLGLIVLGAGFQCDLTKEYYPTKFKLSGNMVEIPIEHKENTLWK